ncbi:hypothetical protein C7974DRAFT_181470 [Boeremia exigua]|uniref:uncharacterized protein n=1 Tax=Boeremia exigua TaxID=749465 RepID=UPI001E8D3D16|nr:uncharacterized protein C7974DRAFT_181470 [Boeremia exigua]KAH6629113.1 hypothetical protein C7974DRAFT_181470 [Boeremia exigua]
MERPTTPTPTSASGDSATPSTPGGNATPGGSTTMRVQRHTPNPSTPGGHHRRIASIPRTPGSSTLLCSSSPDAFAQVTVHTSKCSECDLRNKGTMLRCPGCTFQICKPCQDKREKGGRSMAHGNMLTPQVATPGSGGSVMRKRPASAVNSAEKQHETDAAKSVGEEGSAQAEKEKLEETKEKKRATKPTPKSKLKSKRMIKQAVLLEGSIDDSSDDDFAPDPASPTANKRRRTELTSKTDGTSDIPSPVLTPAGIPSPFLTPTGKAKDSTRQPSLGDSTLTGKSHRNMTTDELLALHGVNTPTNPYKSHFLSRDEPVVSNPVIRMPEVVKRGFKPRPTAKEIQKNIQDTVREKLGLPKLDGP